MTVAEFAAALSVTLAAEGGYNDKPHDKGGPTNWGISQRWLQDYLGVPVSREQIKALTKEQAIKYYQDAYWLVAYYEIDSQLVATKVFDIAVNCGHSRAHKILQAALNSLGEDLDEDGQFGPLTLAAVNAHGQERLLEAIISQQQAFYRALAARDPTQQVHLAGWLKRAGWPFTGGNKHA